MATAQEHLRRRYVRIGYGSGLRDGVSLRRASKRRRIDVTTSFRWRQRILNTEQGTKAQILVEVIQAD